MVLCRKDFFPTGAGRICLARVLAGLAPWFLGLPRGRDSPGSCCRGLLQVCKVWAGERGRAAPRQARRGQGWLLESLELRLSWGSTSWTRATAGEHRGLQCARRGEPLKLEGCFSKNSAGGRSARHHTRSFSAPEKHSEPREMGFVADSPFPP